MTGSKQRILPFAMSSVLTHAMEAAQTGNDYLGCKEKGGKRRESRTSCLAVHPFVSPKFLLLGLTPDPAREI